MQTYFVMRHIQGLVPLSLKRSLTTSSCVCGRKTREPYDHRFEISPKDAGTHHTWGNKKVADKVARERLLAPQPPGYFNKQGQFILVKEMVPEFIVPDLTGFKLKPYVSWRVEGITQSEFTPKDLFDACYGKAIAENVQRGKMDPKKVTQDDILKQSSSA